MRALKRSHLEQLADHTRTLYEAPQLRRLFLELTLRCNERCYHCGSSCTSAAPEGELSCDEWRAVLNQVAADFDPRALRLCVTGGEPLLRHDFFGIMEHAHDLGFSWGMTTNGTLITPEVAHRLARAGMRTVSVSVDGPRAAHDELRGRPGAFAAALRGVHALLDEGAFDAVQITTVVNHATVPLLDEMFELFDALDIDSWRVINVEPIGRALERPDLACTPDDLRCLFAFIRAKRKAGFNVEYGCSHYLGLDFEAEVRPWYFLCTAGLYTASVMANGDIGACLDIPRAPELVQGNVRRDRLLDVWEGGFSAFRHDLSQRNEHCRACAHERFCRGGAHHSWDWQADAPLICLKGVLFQ